MSLQVRLQRETQPEHSHRDDTILYRVWDVLERLPSSTRGAERTNSVDLKWMKIIFRLVDLISTLNGNDG